MLSRKIEVIEIRYSDGYVWSIHRWQIEEMQKLVEAIDVMKQAENLYQLGVVFASKREKEDHK